MGKSVSEYMDIQGLGIKTWHIAFFLLLHLAVLRNPEDLNKASF